MRRFLRPTLRLPEPRRRLPILDSRGLVTSNSLKKMPRRNYKDRPLTSKGFDLVESKK